MAESYHEQNREQHMADKNKQNSHPDNVAAPQSCILAFDPHLPCSPILPNFPGIHGAIMQNKPNFKIGKMILTLSYVKYYADFPLPRPRKNKANQTQIAPCDIEYEFTLHASRDTNFKYDIAVPSLDRPEMTMPIESQLCLYTRR